MDALAATRSSPGWKKVLGIGSERTWEGGQMTANARPTTALSGIVPSPGSSV